MSFDFESIENEAEIQSIFDAMMPEMIHYHNQHVAFHHCIQYSPERKSKVFEPNLKPDSILLEGAIQGLVLDGTAWRTEVFGKDHFIEGMGQLLKYRRINFYFC